VVTPGGVAHEVVSPAQSGKHVPPPLHDLVTRMLAKDPADRCASARDVLTELRIIWHQSTHPEVTPSQLLVAPDTLQRSWKRLGSWVLAALLVAVTTVLLLRTRLARELPVQERSWVLITDFDNRTGNPVFDHSLPVALAAYLDQSSQIKVFPDDRARRALTQLGLPETAPMDRQVASQIVFRERIPLMVAGSIVGVGDRYLLSLQLFDPYRQDAILSLAAEAQGAEEVLPKLNDLARTLRREAGESVETLHAADRPMEQITTSSLEALQSYAAGRKEHVRGNYAQAAALYKEALRRDPDFALAHARLSAVYKNLGETELSRDALQQAWRRTERVSGPERQVISALYFMEREEYESAIEALLALEGLHPDHPEGSYYLTICYLLNMDLESAEKAGRRAVELDPSPAARNNLAVVLVTRNKFNEAASLLEAARAQDRDVADLARLLTLAYAGAGQVDRARKQVEALQTGSAQAQMYGRENMVVLLLYQGRW
ncbi:MAG: tetratricopeptide repeat protein, partial [Acidobacteria bacterium]|nr:tetratricopeptide repeat protein [Acidobacteriota bacterium]